MRWLAPLAALLLAACAHETATLPPAPIPYGPAIVVDAEPVPLDPSNPKRERIGNFAYAGGVALTSEQTARFHGLSDMKAWPDGRLLLQSDQSDMATAKVVLDAKGRLIGLTDVRLWPMKNEKGEDWYQFGQPWWDSEGVAVLANGDVLSAFEQHDRILLYPHDGGPPREVPKPDITYVNNLGIEALAAAPEVGPDAYRVGIEIDGKTFLCRLATGCKPDRVVDIEGMALVAMEHLPGGRMAYLFRSFNALTGAKSRLTILDAAGAKVDELVLERPLTNENFEGLGVVARPNGTVRFYIVADDNFGAYAGQKTGQRELMLAFDWTPPKTK